MSHVFKHGPFTASLLPVKSQCSSLSDLPDILVTLKDNDEEPFIPYRGLKFSVDLTATTEAEMRKILDSPVLMSELLHFLKEKEGVDAMRLFPEPRHLLYKLTYPDCNFGDLSAAGQKIFAKMVLRFDATVRMYRPHRQDELARTCGIFGRWECGGEYGIFSVEGGSGRCLMSEVVNPEHIALELADEFRKRWPLYPEATFTVMSYKEVEPFLNKRNVFNAARFVNGE